MNTIQERLEVVREQVYQNNKRRKEIDYLNELYQTIWRVEVSIKYLTFYKVDRPEDFFEVAEKQPYGELNGLYCGDRSFDSKVFSLHRDIKWEDNHYHSGKYKGCREWRMAHGFGYAWEPSYYYKYNGELYATHVYFQ